MTTKQPIAVVTGGAGFIGSHVVDRLLADGFKVRVVDSFATGNPANLAPHAGNPDLEVAEIDIRALDRDAAVFAGADQVFHFAGIGEIVPSIENPAEYIEVNVQGTVNVLECARRRDVSKFIYAASSSCYGLADTPTDESHPINPMYPYALSKYLGESASLHWHKVYGLPVNSIRIFNAYGTRQRTSGTYGAVFGVFLRQMIAGTPLTVVGDGTQTRDFLYVTDVAHAFVLAGRSVYVGRVYNLGAGSPVSVNRLTELLGGESVHIPRRPGEPDCTWADISRISDELGWHPEVTFDDGVAEVVRNIDHWRDAPLWNPDSIADATRSWFKYMPENG